MTFWIAAALATRWLYLRCFSCSTGSIVSITPSPPKFSHLAKPWYASTLFVVAVICSRSLASFRKSSRNTVRPRQVARAALTAQHPGCESSEQLLKLIWVFEGQLAVREHRKRSDQPLVRRRLSQPQRSDGL